MLYVVSVLYDRSRDSRRETRYESAVAMVTDDLIQAVETAKNIRELGYPIATHNGARVLRCEPGTVIPMSQYRYDGGVPELDYPVIFWAGLFNTHNWTEKWMDTGLQRFYIQSTQGKKTG